MEDTIWGLFFGFMVGVLVCLLILLPLSPKWFEKDEIIVRKSKTGLVCKLDENYPKMNCQLIREAIGPVKTNEIEFKVEEK